MCVITTLSSIGAGLAYAASAIGTATAAAGSAVGAGAAAAAGAAGATAATAGTVGGVTAGLATGAINGALIGSATGAIGGAVSGQGIGRGALMGAGIGAAGGAAVSGVGMALNGVPTATSSAYGVSPAVTENTGGLLTDPSTTTVMNGEKFFQVTDSTGTHWVSEAEAAADGSSASGSLGLSSPDPSTYGQMAAQLGSGVFDGVSGYQESKENANNLKYQAKLDKIRAGQALQAAEVEKMDNARKQRQLIGSGRAAAAANGVMLESRAESAPAMFEQDAQAELAWDNAKIDYNANMEAWGYMANAKQALRQARSLRRMGNLKVATGLIKGGLGAATSYFGGVQRASANSLYA